MSTEVAQPTSIPEPRDGRVLPQGSGSRDEADRIKQQKSRSEEEGVEVVLDGHSGSTVVVPGHPRPTPDQNVFRAPNPVRPRAMRAPHGPPHVQTSGSYGYGAPPRGEYGRPYPVPYNPSGSFDDGSYHPPPTHYSPAVQYPPPGGRHSEDVNVISPSHKGDHRPPTSRRGYPPRHYQYPPTSPVSRPEGPSSGSPQRGRNYGMRRPEGPYSAAQRGRAHSDDGTWNAYPTPTSSADRPRPPLVTESSFDSDHYSSHTSNASQPTTPPGPPHYGPPRHHDPRYGFYGNGSFGGSFDSHAPPPHFDDYRYYGHSPHHHPESPYSSYSYHGYSPGGYYDHYPPHRDYGHARSYEEGEGHYRGHPNAVTPNDSRGKKDSNSGMMLPKAAQEIDFEVTDPPMEPITEPSKSPICESPADVNSYDVLCGRGGGTNSQIGNRRFRKLVQEFQPTYLLARRKEKPLLARTIVLIIRKRGGRFLKKDDETGELFEVGDAKAEAKTSQALREGLDVRATKSAASSLLDKKKKKKKKEKEDAEKDDESEGMDPKGKESSSLNAPESPPSLPRLNGEEHPSGRPPSPDQMQFRKRRRMRSGDSADKSGVGCGVGFQDKLFPDFCPPRADLGRCGSPTHLGGADPMDLSHTPTSADPKYDDDDDIRYEVDAQNNATGCAGIALNMVTGAATGSFCLGPRKWR